MWLGGAERHVAGDWVLADVRVSSVLNVYLLLGHFGAGGVGWCVCGRREAIGARCAWLAVSDKPSTLASYGLQWEFGDSVSAAWI